MEPVGLQTASASSTGLSRLWLEHTQIKLHILIRSSGMLRSVDRQLVTDVSGQTIGPILKNQAVQEEETLVNANIHRVTSQKSEDLICTPAKA